MLLLMVSRSVLEYIYSCQFIVGNYIWFYFMILCFIFVTSWSLFVLFISKTSPILFAFADSKCNLEIIYLCIIMKDTRKMFMISSTRHFDWLMEFISAVVILSQFESCLNFRFLSLLIWNLRPYQGLRPIVWDL